MVGILFSPFKYFFNLLRVQGMVDVAGLQTNIETRLFAFCLSNKGQLQVTADINKLFLYIHIPKINSR